MIGLDSSAGQASLWFTNQDDKPDGLGASQPEPLSQRPPVKDTFSSWSIVSLPRCCPEQDELAALPFLQSYYANACRSGSTGFAATSVPRGVCQYHQNTIAQPRDDQ